MMVKLMEATQREAMRAMHDALAAAEGARCAREEFLSRMSHELRTPLNAVIGFSRVLEANHAGNQRPEDIDMLRRVRAGGEHLLKLVENVLEQARIARGPLYLERVDSDVSAIARRVVATYKAKAKAIGLQLVIAMPEAPMIVPLDPGRFELVLHHLVDNAIKFTSRGTILVEGTTDPASGRPTGLSVTDSGIGIPADRLHEIFEPFEQVEGGRHRRYEGAGLGLPLARQLCCAMGCALTVTSAPGQGSRFTIDFQSQS